MKITRRVLHKPAKDIDFAHPVRNQQLEQQMFWFMDRENGIGLAAPQIGISKRLFVMRIQGRERACFNPEILEKSQILVEYNEGCLSFPGDSCTIARPDTIIVKYQDYRGNWIEDSLVSLEARCFQHELDHLDGITMWDRLKEQNAK